MRHEIIRSLETIQDQVRQELLHVRTYRAFLAVDQAIEEISEDEEIVGSLNVIRKQVVVRLHDVREYRALLAVDKSIADISEVLGILAESALKRFQSKPQNGAAPAPAGHVSEDSAPSAVVVSKAHEPEPPAEPSSEAAETVATDVVHQADAASRSDVEAIEHPPAVATAATAEPAHEQEQPPEPVHETVEMAAGHLDHEAVAAIRSEMDAIGHSPFMSTVAASDHPHEHQQPPEPSREAAEYVAAHVLHERHAPSRSEMDAIGHPAAPPTALTSDQTHDHDHEHYHDHEQPPGEAAEHVEDHVDHDGDAEKAHDIGIARVA